MDLVKYLQIKEFVKEHGMNVAVASVREAYALLSSEMGQILKGELYRSVADYISKEENAVYGTTSEYHNLCNLYLDLGDYVSVLKICHFALQRKPYNVDLLALAIRSAAAIGNLEEAYSLIKQAECIQYNHWNWRLFSFVIRAYMEMASAYDDTHESELWEKALHLTEEYKRVLPLDESAWDLEAELYLMRNDVKKAGEVLFQAIFDEVDIESDMVFSHNGETTTTKRLLTRQCCITFIDKILEDTSNYELIIKVAEKGIKDTVEEQPSVKIGYFVYRIAMAKDALCEEQKYENPDKVIEALQWYQTAFSLLTEDAEYSSNIENRYKILQQHAKKDEWINRPLLRQSLSIAPELAETDE